MACGVPPFLLPPPSVPRRYWRSSSPRGGGAILEVPLVRGSVYRREPGGWRREGCRVIGSKDGLCA